VYQVMTDRFARTDVYCHSVQVIYQKADAYTSPQASTSACANLNDYCGGTYKGLINKLDYIQTLGFTAVRLPPTVLLQMC
jgi:alpha-amylase